MILKSAGLDVGNLSLPGVAASHSLKSRAKIRNRRGRGKELGAFPRFLPSDSGFEVTGGGEMMVKAVFFSSQTGRAGPLSRGEIVVLRLGMWRVVRSRRGSRRRGLVLVAMRSVRGTTGLVLVATSTTLAAAGTMFVAMGLRVPRRGSVLVVCRAALAMAGFMYVAWVTAFVRAGGVRVFAGSELVGAGAERVGVEVRARTHRAAPVQPLSEGETGRSPCGTAGAVSSGVFTPLRRCVAYKAATEWRK